MTKKWLQILIFLSLFILTNSASAFEKRKVNIAAASDMKFALDELKTNFELANPNVELGITMGSSGKFFEQISNGAPFDLFFSADIEFPKKLIAAGFGTEVTPYAIGKIVLWSIKYKLFELEDLKNSKLKKIAIANPMHAPYGARAMEALKKMGVYDSIKDRLVLGENISQTAQFVEVGAADAGIVALSIVMSPNLKGKGTYKIISDKLYSPLVQGFILLQKGNIAAANFATYMKSEKAKEILRKYGF